MCCSHVVKLLLALVVLAIAALLLARLALRQYALIAQLTAKLEAAGAAKPVKRVSFAAPSRADASTSTEAPAPALDLQREQEAASAIEAVVRKRQRRAYKVGVEAERAWAECVAVRRVPADEMRSWSFMHLLHARWLVPGPALLDLLLPNDPSYPNDPCSPPTLEQAQVLGHTLAKITQHDRRQLLAGNETQTYAYNTCVSDAEDPAQRMMREAERMREEREREFLEACPPIVTLSPTASSVGGAVGPAPTPRFIVDDEAIVVWNEGVQRATASQSPVRSPGERPPAFDSAFVSGASDERGRS